MHPARGPRQPVSAAPNGNPDYTFNPMEDLPVEEYASWEDLNVSADYMTEPVFSSQALYGITHGNTESQTPRG